MYAFRNMNTFQRNFTHTWDWLNFSKDFSFNPSILHKEPLLLYSQNHYKKRTVLLRHLGRSLD